MDNLKKIAAISKPAEDLEAGDILIGSRGGHSEIYECEESSAMPGMMAVETEHGFLYLDIDPDEKYDVLILD